MKIKKMDQQDFKVSKKKSDKSQLLNTNIKNY